MPRCSSFAPAALTLLCVPVNDTAEREYLRRFVNNVLTQVDNTTFILRQRCHTIEWYALTVVRRFGGSLQMHFGEVRPTQQRLHEEYTMERTLLNSRMSVKCNSVNSIVEVV